MLFQTPTSNFRALQERLTVPTLFVMAQAARQGNALSYAHLADAVLKSIGPVEEKEEALTKRALFDLFAKRELVKLGLVSYAKGRWENSPPYLNITQRGMAMLGRRCVDLIELPKPDQDILVNADVPRNLEKTVVIPMLVTLVKLYEEKGLPVGMTELREATKRSMHLSPEDLGPLQNRSDTKIDQLMRNVKSHNTLRKNGWVKEKAEGMEPTEKAMAKVAEEFLSLLPSPRFNQKMLPEEQAPEQVKQTAETVVRPTLGKVRR